MRTPHSYRVARDRRRANTIGDDDTLFDIGRRECSAQPRRSRALEATMCCGHAGADTLAGGSAQTPSIIPRPPARPRHRRSRDANGERRRCRRRYARPASNATGSAFNDTLTGSDGDNGLRGGAGADTLAGDAGVDTVDYAASGARDGQSCDANRERRRRRRRCLSGFENVIGSGSTTR